MDNQSFEYTYNAAQQQEIKDIRSKYLPREEDKMERLRKLHNSATQKAQSASIAVGVIGALLLGTGMSLCMTELGAALGLLSLILGVAVGLVGILLVALGYPVGNVDGSFGAETLRALNLFQGDAGFREQTTATSDLLDVLYSKAAPKYNAYKTRRSGNIGVRVQMIQERLNDLGYKAGEEDGVYGKNTVAAVKAFQQDNKLTVDGVAGPATLKKLYANNAASKPTATPEPTQKPEATQKPEPTETPKATDSPTPTPVPDTSLKLGDKSTAVKALNQRLYEL